MYIDTPINRATTGSWWALLSFDNIQNVRSTSRCCIRRINTKESIYISLYPVRTLVALALLPLRWDEISVRSGNRSRQDKYVDARLPALCIDLSRCREVSSMNACLIYKHTRDWLLPAAAVTFCANRISRSDDTPPVVCLFSHYTPLLRRCLFIWTMLRVMAEKENASSTGLRRFSV